MERSLSRCIDRFMVILCIYAPPIMPCFQDFILKTTADSDPALGLSNLIELQFS
jgi:hypothetical protein